MPEPGDAHRLPAPAGRRVPKGVLLAGTGQMLPLAGHGAISCRITRSSPASCKSSFAACSATSKALAKLVMGLGKFLEEVDAEEAELRAMMTKATA